MIDMTLYGYSYHAITFDSSFMMKIRQILERGLWSISPPAEVAASAIKRPSTEESQF